MNVGMSDESADSIDGSIRRFGRAKFSTTERMLGYDDFSVKFVPPTKFDKLTNDVIVRARLDGFEERRATFSDELARKFAVYIAEDLAKSYKNREIVVGVELMLVGVGLFWGTASTSVAFSRTSRSQISGEALFGD